MDGLHCDGDDAADDDDGGGDAGAFDYCGGDCAAVIDGWCVV